MDSIIAELIKSGVDLTKPVVVIAESETITGDFIPTHVQFGFVLADLPEGQRAAFPEFDSLYDVCVLSCDETSHHLGVFFLIDDASLLGAPQTVILDHQMYRVTISQAPQTMTSGQNLLKAMRAQLGKGST